MFSLMPASLQASRDHRFRSSGESFSAPSFAAGRSGLSRSAGMTVSLPCCDKREQRISAAHSPGIGSQP